MTNPYPPNPQDPNFQGQVPPAAQQPPAWGGAPQGAPQFGAPAYYQQQMPKTPVGIFNVAKLAVLGGIAVSFVGVLLGWLFSMTSGYFLILPFLGGLIQMLALASVGFGAWKAFEVLEPVVKKYAEQ